MKKFVFIFMLLGIFTVQAYGVDSTTEINKNWHRWRGPVANGFTLSGSPLIEWSEGKNVKWKIEIPGRGHASPIVTFGASLKV